MIRRFTKRTGALPRERPSPETNVIQAPELLNRLAQRMGIRQAHVSPTLTEGLSPVIIVEDLTQKHAAALPHYFIAGSPPGGDGATLRSTIIFYNPILSGALVRVKAIQSGMTIDPGAGAATFGVISLHTLIAPFVFPPGGASQVGGSFTPISCDPRAELDPTGASYRIAAVRKSVMQTWTGQCSGLAGTTHNARRIYQIGGFNGQGVNSFLTPQDLILREGTYLAMQPTDTLAGSVADLAMEYTEEPATQLA